MDCKLTAINVYPLKAAQAVQRPQAMVTALGLEGDRRWLVTDDQGRFVSQRSHPRLALITVSEADNGILLAGPGMPDLKVEFPAPGSRQEVAIWKDQVSAALCPDNASSWISSFLGQPSHLAFMDDQCHRPITSNRVKPGHMVSFADGYPLLLVSQASLDLLNSKLTQPVPMDRFRANLVISGCDSHQEDTWKRFQIGEAIFQGVKPCSRCQVPTIDQSTGQAAADQEPLRTLGSYRQKTGGIMFGMNLVVEQEGIISCGDKVEILG